MDLKTQRFKAWKYVAIYYGIACATSWLLWVPLILGQDGLRLLPIAPFLPVIICTGTVGPLLACYIAHRLETGNWHATVLTGILVPMFNYNLLGGQTRDYQSAEMMISAAFLFAGAAVSLATRGRMAARTSS